MGDEAAQDRDHGLARADIALQETVHLMAAGQVCADFFDDPFLGSGQVEWKFAVQGIECLADFRHVDADFAAAAYVFLFQQ